ncbi:hypothetical protein LQ318_08440 [Aliifodinibius salicampi]|uniref:Uncharacterized protein n=1 Tax=Fodinibius salicampi TaxID=1920655 RepID=A0ABT3PYL9_9BACT|nr:hypothetical protein [Fodinibius salicampi]MCW9712931.1 hypothetical protein [Fodinibius salicampi]
MLQQDIDFIESREIAADIMLGNTAIDMYYRAIDNPKLKKVFKSIESDPTLIELVLTKFKNFIDKEHSYTFVGTFLAYLAVFSKSKSVSVKKELIRVCKMIDNESLLYDALNLTIEELNKKIENQANLISEKEYLIGESGIFSVGSDLGQSEGLALKISTEDFTQERSKMKIAES